jgi:HSP20 family molecular chaperone IbpA
MVRPTTTTPYGENNYMNIAQALDRLYADAFPLASYPPPRATLNNVDFVYNDKSGTYTATIDAAGADKTKFNVNISNGALTVSYRAAEGFRCRPFTYTFNLGRNVNVAESVGEYKDGVLRVDVHTTTQRNDTFNVPIH